MIQHRSSSSSLQQNIVHHSNINESAAITASPTNRFDLNYSTEYEQTKRQGNNLMTVYEQGSNNDLFADDKWQVKPSSTTTDVIPQRTTDEKPIV